MLITLSCVAPLLLPLPENQRGRPTFAEHYGRRPHPGHMLPRHLRSGTVHGLHHCLHEEIHLRKTREVTRLYIRLTREHSCRVVVHINLISGQNANKLHWRGRLTDRPTDRLNCTYPPRPKSTCAKILGGQISNTTSQLSALLVPPPPLSPLWWQISSGCLR